jgi:hypothetical protein
MQPEHALLLEQLRAAFPPEPIRAAGALGDWGMTYLDVEPYSQHIEGKTWEELDRCIPRVPALTPRGQHRPVKPRTPLLSTTGRPTCRIAATSHRLLDNKVTS